MPDWLIGLAVAALLVPGAGYVLWEPAKLARQWRIDARKRTKYDYTRLTLWWHIWGPNLSKSERIGGLFGSVDLDDAPLEIKDWTAADVDQLAGRLLVALWELAAEAPLARLERDADRARRALDDYRGLLHDPDFYAPGVIDDSGQHMLVAFRRLYRRDPLLSVHGVALKQRA